MYSRAGSGGRRPEDAGVAAVVGPGTVQDRADEDRHADRPHRAVDLGRGRRVDERVDVGGVLRPHHEVAAAARCRRGSRRRAAASRRRGCRAPAGPGPRRPARGRARCPGRPRRAIARRPAGRGGDERPRADPGDQHRAPAPATAGHASAGSRTCRRSATAEPAAGQRHGEGDQRRTAERGEPAQRRGGLAERQPAPREPAERHPVAQRLLQHPRGSRPRAARPGSRCTRLSTAPEPGEEHRLGAGEDQPRRRRRRRCRSSAAAARRRRGRRGGRARRRCAARRPSTAHESTATLTSASGQMPSRGKAARRPARRAGDRAAAAQRGGRGRRPAADVPRSRIDPVSPSTPAPATRGSQPSSAPASKIGTPARTVARQRGSSAPAARSGRPCRAEVGPAAARRRSRPARQAPARPAPGAPAARQPAGGVRGEAARLGADCRAGSGGCAAAAPRPTARAAVTGASEPNASATPAAASAANRLSCRGARRRRAAARTCRPGRPRSRRSSGCTDASSPDAASRAGSRTNSACSMRCPAPAGRPRRPAGQLDRVEHLVDGGVADGVEAGLQPGARRTATMCSASSAVVEPQHAGRLRPVGVRRAQRGGVRAERAVAEQVARRADGAEVARRRHARRARPSSRSPPAPARRRPGPAARPGRRLAEIAGPAISCTQRDAEPGGVAQRGRAAARPVRPGPSAPSAAVRDGVVGGPRSRPSGR